MNKIKIDITPSTEILHATKRTGYAWTDAVFELQDNALDSLRAQHEKSEKRRNLCVRVHPERRKNAVGIVRIIVSDNGTGIDSTFIKTGKIFKMGESRTRELSDDATGAFGMGLKAAAQSLGNKVTILSTTSTLKNLVGITWDFDETLRTHKWEASYIEQPSKEQKKLFNKFVGNISGTVVIIDDVNTNVPTAPAFITTLKGRAAHYYRHLLNQESKLGYSFPFNIYIGGPTYKGAIPRDSDPLCITSDRTRILIGDKDGSFKEYDFKGYKFYVRLVHAKFAAGERASQTEGLEGLGRYIQGVLRQGAYFIRNGREIACKPVWKAQSASSNMFAEIAFVDNGREDPNHPSYIKTDYGKKGIVMDDEFEKYIRKVIFEPFVRKLAKEARDAAAEITKTSRTKIFEAIESIELPPDKFGRGKAQTDDQRTASKTNKIFEKSKNKVSRKNSKYRGCAVTAGNNNVEIKFDEQYWRGSDYPYDVDYTAGDPVVKIVLNLAHDWIRKNIYTNTNTNEVARALQTVAACCVSIMYVDEQVKKEFLEAQGTLLNLFDDDFGRVCHELDGEELEEAPVFDAPSGHADNVGTMVERAGQP